MNILDRLEESIKKDQDHLDLLIKERDYYSSLSTEQQLAIELHDRFARMDDRWSCEITIVDKHTQHVWTKPVHKEWADRANRILVILQSIRDHSSTITDGAFKITRILGET